MRIKHLLTWKQDHNPRPLKSLATYQLTIDIYNFSKESQFLINNNRTKTINKKLLKHFYKDIINYIKKNKDISKAKGEPKII